MKRIRLLTYVMMALLALCSCQPTGNNLDVDRKAFPVKGIDVSSHNGRIDFKAVARDSVSFVIIKATEGSDFCDAFFARNFDQAKQARLITGAYHFFRFDTPGHLQAYHFLNTIAGREPDLPLIIDVEDWTNPDISRNDVVNELKQMVMVLQNSGHSVMIYTNRNGYLKYVMGNFKNVPLWICNFSGQPSFAPNWRIWQHSHRGRVRGIRGDVDINTYRGSLSDLKSWIKKH